jgi:hypothetical protein
MDQKSRLDDPRIAAIGAALGPNGWRSMSAEMVARRIVGAIDSPEASERSLAPHDDDRVELLQWALSRCVWRSFTNSGVARYALAELGAWHERRRWLEVELAWLLDDAA